MAKLRSLSLLVLAEVAAMSLWFSSAAIIGDMAQETPISPTVKAALSAAVQAGFVVGAIVSAITGIADRYDPRRVFASAAVIAAAANFVFQFAPIGSFLAVGLRFVTGASLAGVYPVGMKIAIGWGKQDRGFLVGLLVGGLTLGSAMPHLIAWSGETAWRMTLVVGSGLSVVAAVLILFCRTGPHHAQSSKFDPSVITVAWTNRNIRAAYVGYLGHMWELYAMWAWIGTILTASFTIRSYPEAASLAKLVTFFAIAVGAISCMLAGKIADRIGKAELAIGAMVGSGLAAVATAVSFGGPVWVTIVCVILWGVAVIPDSAQFSALVADFAQPEQAGSLLSFQTAIGFALTTLTVQAAPLLAEMTTWPVVICVMAVGPAIGVVAMMPLRGRVDPVCS